MRKLLLIAIGIIACTLAVAQTSIYNIQYTTIAGDGTYPSSFSGQTVTTGGIVTATNYSGGRYFISSSAGGPWNGIFIYDNTNAPSIGDSIVITGKVVEYNGYTEISNLTSFNIKSSSNPLPPATKISSANVTSEAYEGVLVEVNNCTVSSLFDQYGNWSVNDGTGKCDIRPGIYSLKNDNFPLLTNYPFTSIVGVVGISYSNISIHPRSINDIKTGLNDFILTSDSKYTYNTNPIEIPVKVANINRPSAITNYSIKMQYNPAVFEYNGYNKTETLSESGTLTDLSTSGNITLNYSGNIGLNITGTLIKLKLTPKTSGDANIQFNLPTINGNQVNFLSSGSLQSQLCSKPIGDTLTIVQRPLLNIPSIVIPGQTLNITCFAPQTTTSWNAELFYNDVTVPLTISLSAYNSDLQRWTLTTTIPNVDLYELYNLRVTASDGILDDVSNAVKVIDQYKSSYYFVHITDTHLPGHTFYGESGYATDESELADLYEVIKDINLLRPEFVLLTGDLINEGELEDFECLRNHTLTVELLKKFEVPVYIVPGNHDLGGWDATPPPQGTARREWWRFFGWRQPQTPPVRAEYYTHDYSFDYGNIHFTGLEAYDNYDSYMYSVYGATSFIPSQLTWLQNDLIAAGSKKKVLFYHYDFKKELNLSALGVDMALWGHIHYDSISTNSPPYNIATAAVCDRKRAFRVIRVNNGALLPQNTIRTHSSGDMLTITYNMANNGSLDSVSATVNNRYSLSFSNGLVKFVMPVSNYGYSVTNGTLEQVLKSGSYATCYVRVNFPLEGIVTTSIKKLNYPTAVEDNTGDKTVQFYPNPFSEDTKMSFDISKQAFVNISVYNIAGQLIKTVANKMMQPGNHTLTWNGTTDNGNKTGDGVYIIKLKLGNDVVKVDQVVLKR